MVKNLYLSGVTESYVEVVACALLENGQFEIKLENTPFHPQGGGQPSDTGYIADSEVLHVAFKNGAIVHRCNRAVALGQVYAKVDIQSRQLHSRLHSAGHLIGHIIETYGWQPIKAQHWPNDAKVQFLATEKSELIDSVYLQTLIQMFVDADLPAKLTLNAAGFREIQFGELNAYPCGGTHVQSLSEIGPVDILKMEIKKGKLSVHYALTTGISG
jgi:Ser-tRNA(Ala) deacylase AlaX